MGLAGVHIWPRRCVYIHGVAGVPPRRESACINSSLSTLGRCLQALRANSTAASSAHVRPVPYRECKLTHLFKDILHGEGALALLVCVSPLAADYEETHHVLKYAALASKIKVALPPPVRCVSAPCGPPVSVLGVAFEPSVATFESVVVAGDVPPAPLVSGKRGRKRLKNRFCFGFTCPNGWTPTTCFVGRSNSDPTTAQTITHW